MTGCSTFGLTYQGIAKIGALLKVKFVVADSFKMLKRTLCLKGDFSFITDVGLLSQGEKRGHAISCFLKTEGSQRRLFVNDSEASFDGHLNPIFKDLFKTLSLQMVVSRVERQPEFEATCNTIAIHDVLAFQQKPKITNEILEMNNLSSENAKEVVFVTKLPKEIMVLSDNLLARKETLKYQLLLIKDVQDQPQERAFVKVAFVIVVIAMCIFVYIKEG